MKSEEITITGVENGDRPEKEIRTSTQGWLEELARCYREKQDVILIDDAKVGINPESDTILAMGHKAKLSTNEWIAVLICLGVSLFGAYLLVMAILDPEPYSKIAIALITGAILLGSGGLAAVRVLTKIKPPNVKVTLKGFEISWD
jgi:hypothetical protein